MKQTFTALAVVFLILAVCNEAWPYASGAPYSWGPGDPNYNPAAVIHAGTINPESLTIADYLGRSPSQPTATGWGDSGVSVGWDDSYAYPVGHGNTNGDALDGLWVQSWYAEEYWFDLGLGARTVVIFTSQDHGWYLEEGLEYRVYGAGTLWDNSSLGPQATLTDIYLDGWRPHNPNEDANGNGWSSDDISAVLDLGGCYRYIMLVPWDTHTGGTLVEPEIDAVGSVPVPEASTLMLFGSGLPGLAVWIRARRKRQKV